MGTEAIQAALNDIAALREQELNTGGRVALLQAEAMLRLAEQIDAVGMPVAGLSSAVRTLDANLKPAIEKLTSS